MKDFDQVTGQRIDYKENNDNAPPSYSAPSLLFKQVLKYHAHEICPRCRGTGYIGGFKSISGGRCFQCIPDEHWDNLLGTLQTTGIDDKTGNPVCEIRYVTTNAYTKSGFIVTRVGLPPIGKPEVFPTIEKACESAKKEYGV